MGKIRSLSTGDFGAGSPSSSFETPEAKRKSSNLPSVTEIYQFLTQKIGDIRQFISTRQELVKSRLSRGSKRMRGLKGSKFSQFEEEQKEEKLENKLTLRDQSNLGLEDIGLPPQPVQKGKPRKESKMSKKRLNDLGNTSVGSGVGMKANLAEIGAGDEMPEEDDDLVGCDNPRFGKKRSNKGKKGAGKKKKLARSPIPPGFQ